jgi:hypothetical protein
MVAEWLKELDGLHENHDGPPEVVGPERAYAIR